VLLFALLKERGLARISRVTRYQCSAEKALDRLGSAALLAGSNAIERPAHFLAQCQ
jgi:hypothetical protein